MADDGARTWILTGSPENYAFQGQLRTVSEADGALLMERMHAAAGVRA
jgi:hypothetical protein